jgi:hypothetical protein
VKLRARALSPRAPCSLVATSQTSATSVLRRSTRKKTAREVSPDVEGALHAVRTVAQCSRRDVTCKTVAQPAVKKSRAKQQVIVLSEDAEDEQASAERAVAKPKAIAKKTKAASVTVDDDDNDVTIVAVAPAKKSKKTVVTSQQQSASAALTKSPSMTSKANNKAKATAEKSKEMPKPTASTEKMQHVQLSNRESCDE